MQVELAGAYEHLGHIQGRPVTSNLGKSDEALVTYRKALLIRTTMAAKAPDNVAVQGALVTCLQRMGATHRSMGDRKKTLELEESAMAIRKNILKLDPSNIKLKRDPATNCTTISLVFNQVGFKEKVMNARERAWQLSIEIAAAYPVDLSDQANLQAALGRLAGIQLVNGKPTEALRNFREVGKRDEGLLGKTPRNPQRKLNLAASYHGLAGTFENVHEFNESREFYRNALEIRKELLAEDPKDFQRSSLLGATYFRLGRVDVMAGRPDDARQGLLHTFDIRTNLMKSAGTHAGAVGEMAEVCMARGQLEAKTDAKKVLDWYNKAEALFAGLEVKGSLVSANQELRAQMHSEMKDASAAAAARR